MLTPTKGSLMVCADKRATNSIIETDYRDTETKIQPLSKRAFYATIGLSKMTKPSNSSKKKEVLFNIDSVVNEYFSGKDHTDLEKVLFPDGKFGPSNQKSAFLTFLSSKLSTEILGQFEATAGRNDIAVQVAFFYLDNHNSPKGYIFTIFYNTLSITNVKAPHPVLLSSGIEDTNPNFFKNSDPLEYGMTDLIKGIRSGKNEKALKLLSDKDKQFFFGEGLQSQGDALIFMRKMIWLSSKKENRNYQETWVSPNCDCAVLNYSKGFMWIGKTLSPKKTQTAN